MRTSIPDPGALIEAVVLPSPLKGSEWHGEDHWKRVAMAGLFLCERIEGADPLLAVLFGLLHDCRRHDEDQDLGHGPRAAAVARALSRQGLLALEPSRLSTLLKALAGHSMGRLSPDTAIAVCWDADRLEIRRGGYPRDPSYLSLAAPWADEIDARIDAHAVPPGWLELMEAAILLPR